MKNKQVRTVLAIGMALCIAYTPVLAGRVGNVPLGKVVAQGPAELNHTPLSAESTVYSDDTVSTAVDGVALVFLGNKGRVYVGPASEVQLAGTEGVMLAQLERGTLLAGSGDGRALHVRARGLLIHAQQAGRYQVALAEDGVVVVSQKGPVTVQGANQTFTVPAGKAMRFEVEDDTQNDKRRKIAIAIAVAAGVVAAIAIPVALREGEVVSPSVP